MTRFTPWAIVISLIAGTVIGWYWGPSIRIVVQDSGVCEVVE